MGVHLDTGSSEREISVELQQTRAVRYKQHYSYENAQLAVDEIRVTHRA